MMNDGQEPAGRLLPVWGVLKALHCLLDTDQYPELVEVADDLLGRLEVYLAKGRVETSEDIIVKANYLLYLHSIGDVHGVQEVARTLLAAVPRLTVQSGAGGGDG